MSTDTPTPIQAFADDVRLLVRLDTQFAVSGETDLNAEQMARLEAHDWIAEGHENGEYEVTELGRAMIARALSEHSGIPGKLTPAGQIVGWRMLGSVTVYMARGASGDMREFVALEDFQATAPQPAVAAPREPAPVVGDNVRAALMLALYYHQGGSSPIGQPIRKMLAIGPFDEVAPPPAPPVDAELQELIDAATEFWVGKRPLSYSGEDHVANPGVNSASPEQHRLLVATAAIQARRQQGEKA